jgi:hypothetical protein
MNQLASANEDSHEEADAADSRADRMTADVLWMTSRLSVRRPTVIAQNVSTCHAESRFTFSHNETSDCAFEPIVSD